MNTGIDRLDDLIELRTLPRDELLSRLGIDEGAVETGYAYEGMTDLAKAYDPDWLPAHVYFDGDEPVMIYTSDSDFLDSLTAADLQANLGEAPLTLRSRAGKRSTLSVYPKVGLAVSYGDEADPVEFVEVFPPTTAEAYEREIYEDPGPFRK